MAKKEGGFNTWLQRVRRTGEFSDVTVRVEGEEFHLHMLPLLNASAYFRNISSTSSTAASSSYSRDLRAIDLTDLPGTAFHPIGTNSSSGGGKEWVTVHFCVV